jgi:hypothetical protein
MTKNVETPIRDLASTPLTDPNGPVTVGSVCLTALLTAGPEDKSTPAEKVSRWKLSQKVHKGGEVEFTPEDLSTLKAAVGPLFGPLVVGQVFDWADA